MPWNRRCLALTTAKRRLAREDPDLFETYVHLSGQGPELHDLHVTALLDQLSTIVSQGVGDGSINAQNPKTTERAAFHGMSQFHHPLHVDYWSDPDLARHYDDLWQLLSTGLRP